MKSITENSVRATLGHDYLARRHHQILEEFKETNNAVNAMGAMQVIAGQAIRELKSAEKRSHDPLDTLRAEDTTAGGW